ncbi:MAG: DUF362 domain-containing protein [Planctomycetes bacterium]|nr:DUF362 domain-containing protein [Planctomycetota bacterium]
MTPSRRKLSRAAAAVFPAILVFVSACTGRPAPTTRGSGPAAATAASSRPADGPVVVIVRGTDPDKMVARAVELLGGMDQFAKDGRKIVIKPNLTWQPAFQDNPPPDAKIRPEITTDPALVEAIAKQMLAQAKCKITIAESSLMGVDMLYRELGYVQVAQKLGLELVNTDAAQRVDVKTDGLARKEYDLPAVTQNCDVLVDVAVMKTHNLACVTLGIKNLFGLVPGSIRPSLHPVIHEVLCDIIAIRKPDLVIVDGRFAMEGDGPIGGTMVNMDLIVAGRDVVAVDAVCASIMGFDPMEIGHIRLAHQKGLGVADLRRITVRGERIEDVRRPFKPPAGETRLEIALDDDMRQSLSKLADEDLSRGLTQRYWFRADRIKKGLGGKAAVHASGFSASWWKDSEKVYLKIPYQLTGDSSRQQAIDEVREWIRLNVEKPASAPATGRTASHPAAGG